MSLPSEACYSCSCYTIVILAREEKVPNGTVKRVLVSRVSVFFLLSGFFLLNLFMGTISANTPCFPPPRLIRGPARIEKGKERGRRPLQLSITKCTNLPFHRLPCCKSDG